MTRWGRLWRRARAGCVLTVLILLTLPLVVEVQAWLLDGLPPAPRPADSGMVLTQDNEPLLTLVAPDGQWRHTKPVHAPLQNWLGKAIVAIEDHRFLDHDGVDWTGVSAAAWANLTGGGIRRGASTITMQVIRLRYPQARSWTYKWQQAVWATFLEDHLDKSAILDEYLQRAPFGANVVGAHAAADHWFATTPDKLTIAEAALLAGLPQNPTIYNPNRGDPRTLRRRNQVLDRMLALGMITRPQHRHATTSPITIRTGVVPQAHRPGTMAASLAITSHRRPVTTTISTHVQSTVDRAADHWQRAWPDADAAVVVIDHASRSISGLWNSAPHRDDTSRPRSSGSILKPFIYVMAMQDGRLGPRTLLNDMPISWGDWSPQNADHQFTGTIPAAKALAQSRNIPAIHVLDAVGVPTMLANLRALGFTDLEHTADHYGLSLAIGGGSVTLRQVAAAYATLATDGRPHDARLTTAALTPLSDQAVIAPTVGRRVLQMLADPARTAAIDARGHDHPIAWKTGTSAGGRDAWCVAVSPAYTVAVWVGHADHRSNTAHSGAATAAPLAIATLLDIDPQTPGWPTDATATPTTGPTALVTRHRQRPLTIISPNCERLRSGSALTLPLTARGGTPPYTWFANNRWLPEARWQVADSGTVTLRCIDAQGRVAQQTVQCH